MLAGVTGGWTAISTGKVLGYATLNTDQEYILYLPLVMKE